MNVVNFFFVLCGDNFKHLNKKKSGVKCCCEFVGRWAAISKVIKHILLCVYICVSWLSSCLSNVQGRSCIVTPKTTKITFICHPQSRPLSLETLKH